MFAQVLAPEAVGQQLGRGAQPFGDGLGFGGHDQLGCFSRDAKGLRGLVRRLEGILGLFQVTHNHLHHSLTALNFFMSLIKTHCVSQTYISLIQNLLKS